jgi:hypothetical protein
MLTQAQIEAGFKCDQQRRGRPLTDPTQVPAAFDDITPEWLTGTLCADHPGAQVVEHQLEPFEEGTTNRTRMRITYNDAGIDAGLPTKLFCKATQGLANRLTLGLSGGAEAEVRFYQHVRPLLDLEAPPGLFANFDSQTANSIVVLEDIADSVSEFCTQNTTINRAQIEDALGLLATLHGAGYSDRRLREQFGHFISWRQFFTNIQVFGLKEGSEEGFRRAEDLVPTRLYKRQDEIWPATIAAVNHAHTLPLTLTHSDVHLKNWYVTDSGAMALSDWQCTSQGHWGRDFGYALATSLTIEDRRTWERDLLAHYLDRLHAAGGPKVDLDEGWLHYRRQLMSALTWWTITYNPAPGMPDMQPMETASEFVKRLATAIDDLDSLDSLSERTS